MRLYDELVRKIAYFVSSKHPQHMEHEFCPRCEANLTLQKGYSNEKPYWICRGCGEMLINPNIQDDSNIVWVCDKCEAMLNIQEGFTSDAGKWICRQCGYENIIADSELYLSEDEYQMNLLNPYKGMNDEAVLELSLYEEIQNIDGRSDIILVRDMDTGTLYVKKILSNYDISVYRYLYEHPIANIPRIKGIFEGDNNLVILEEYVKGSTLEDILNNGILDNERAIFIAKSICIILSKLHSVNPAIVHRDIKPSNIIISEDGEVYLLDINIAKWVRQNESEDTHLLGTLHYAAPEQFGYGFSASNEKADIYAVGILLNVMLTGKLPKELKAPDPIWKIIEKCIDFDADKRYTAEELRLALEKIGE